MFVLKIRNVTKRIENYKEKMYVCKQFKQLQITKLFVIMAKAERKTIAKRLEQRKQARTNESKAFFERIRLI